jgi:hypothetical protein
MVCIRGTDVFVPPPHIFTPAQLQLSQLSPIGAREIEEWAVGKPQVRVFILGPNCRYCRGVGTSCACF